MKASLRLLAIPLAAGALVFAGCGGDDNSSDNTSDTTTTTEQPATNATGDTGNANGNAAGEETAKGTIALAADPAGALAYDPSDLEGKAGPLTIEFTNDSPIPHDVVIDGPDGKEVAKTSVFTGGTEAAKFDAKPGDYTFYCSVAGHREGGMEGTLTVK